MTSGHVGTCLRQSNKLFSAAAPPRIAALTSSSALFCRLAPEQATGPDCTRRMSAGKPAPLRRACGSVPRLTSFYSSYTLFGPSSQIFTQDVDLLDRISILLSQHTEVILHIMKPLPHQVTITLENFALPCNP